jgi:hypothetical protein
VSRGAPERDRAQKIVALEELAASTVETHLTLLHEIRVLGQVQSDAHDEIETL